MTHDGNDDDDDLLGGVCFDCSDIPIDRVVKESVPEVAVNVSNVQRESYQPLGDARGWKGKCWAVEGEE